MVTEHRHGSGGFTGTAVAAETGARMTHLRWNSLSLLAAAAWLTSAHPAGAQTIFVQESFEDTNYAARGWYDSTGGALSSVEKFAGAKSYECRFAVGGTKRSGGDIARHKFPDSDAVYIAYYVKHSTNWVGSGTTFHPHMFMFLTNENGDYSGLAYTHLTAYIENNYL